MRNLFILSIITFSFLSCEKEYLCSGYSVASGHPEKYDKFNDTTFLSYPFIGTKKEKISEEDQQNAGNSGVRWDAPDTSYLIDIERTIDCN